jgi:hypothetical protein
LIVSKGVAAHLSAPNQLTAYESRDNLLGNPLIEDRLYIPDFIIVMCEPCIMCIIAISHPRVPSLAIAELTIARWPFMIPFLGLSGMAPIIVVIVDK